MGKIEEIIKVQKEVLEYPESRYNPINSSYLLDYRDNLVEDDMDEMHKRQYGQGSGGELDGNLPKMASVRSSSAMTFNLLGNKTTRFFDNKYNIMPGDYSIVYEKQMYTLGCEGNPANLDAFLENGNRAVFCEMKMLEWFNKANHVLDDKYRKTENYFLEDGYIVFRHLIDIIEAEQFVRYDAWQMLKHTLAIFNALMKTSPDRNAEKHGRELRSLGLSGKYKEVVLANVVYMITEGTLDSKRCQSYYMKAEEEERLECRRFIDIMLGRENGLLELFEKHCNVSFDIQFITAGDFASIQHKENEKFLQRYWKV